MNYIVYTDFVCEEASFDDEDEAIDFARYKLYAGAKEVCVKNSNDEIVYEESK